MKHNYEPLPLFIFLKRNSKKSFLLLILLALFSSVEVYSQVSYTFTPAGATGVNGPIAANINTAYASTNLNGSVTVAGGIQSWTVPVTGGYRIEAFGAQGGSVGTNTGGLGAVMRGEFNFTAGTVLNISVGQAGMPSASGGGGGGGGSGVRQGVTLLIVAGGGGGAGFGTASVGNNNGMGGVITNSGTATTSGLILGGTNGNGGAAATFNGGGCAGGGMLSAGAKPPGGTPNTAGAGGFGAIGGALSVWCSGTAGAGGFGVGGGGGGEGQAGGAGGGGGYSGGGGGEWSQQGWCSVGYGYGGGGGGSYNIGTNQNNTNASSSGQGKVIITELCAITLTANGTNANGAICSGSSVTLTTNGISNYSWSTGATTSSVIVVSPTITTIYTLSATSPSNCTANVALTVTVDPAVPNLSIVNSANAGGICPFRTATLTASGATTYTWTGGTPVTNGVSFSPSLTSGYTVTGQNACGTSTAATSISIHPIPIINVSASTPSLCSGLTLTLTATGNYTNHTWAGGYTSGIGFFPSLTNTYVATGTSSLSCTNTAAVIVTVVTTPALAPTYPSLICFGNSATLTATGATNYTWLPGNANTSSIVVSPGITTSYTVIKSNANCVDSKTFTLNVNALPGVFAIVTPTVICALKTATLFGGGALTFTWAAPPSFSFTGNSPIVAPGVPTTYTVTGSDGICTNTTTVFLAVDPNPTINVSGTPSVICAGDQTSLTANGGINYTWTATSGTVYTASFTASPTVATLYSVIGDNTFGCTSGANQIILVNQLPNVGITATKTLVCVGGESKLTASGANTYQWDAGAGGAITSTVQVNPMTTTSYTVQGTNANTGCKNTKSILITVFDPSVAVSSPTSTCFGGNMNLVASGATSYTWHLGNGVTHAFATILVTPTVLTIYTVTALTSTIGGLSCPSTNTTSVDIFYNPTITATAQRPSICKNESVQLFGAGGTVYSWNDPQSQNGATITVSPQQQTTYTLTGTDNNGCVSTGTVMVKVSPCVGINELNRTGTTLTIYPNPSNGNFVVQSDTDIKLTLSNELGQVIRTFNLSALNNNVSITDLPNGIYFISGQKDALTIKEKIVVVK